MSTLSESVCVNICSQDVLVVVVQQLPLLLLPHLLPLFSQNKSIHPPRNVKPTLLKPLNPLARSKPTSFNDTNARQLHLLLLLLLLHASCCLVNRKEKKRKFLILMFCKRVHNHRRRTSLSPLFFIIQHRGWAAMCANL